jgi:hypothetical protein
MLVQPNSSPEPAQPPGTLTVSENVLAQDYLDRIALDYLQFLLQSFHGVIKHSPCKGEYLEELFWRTLKHRYAGLDVVWEAGSHQKSKDIDVRSPAGALPAFSLPVSVKSGQWNKAEDALSISGPRTQSVVASSGGGSTLQIWQSGGGARLVEHLNSADSEIVIFAASKPRNASFPDRIIYDICCLKPDLFEYPDVEDWECVRSASGSYTFRAVLSSGVIISVRPSMSWQIWWEIPRRAVRLLRRMEIK